jgi:hypothetical protein
LPSFGVSLTRQVNPVFCVPPNNQLDAYWDRVEDRLYKIRHCMNISGVRRQLALFAPPIDPGLLVRARAAGVSIEDALGLTAGELPPYRFNALIGSAQEYAQAVQTFGAALLAALEKKDAEELAQLRLVHEENLQKLQTQVREQEVETARRNLEAVTKRQATVEYRKSYFQGLLDTGLNSWEVTQSAARHASNVLKGGASILDFLAGAFHVAPEIGAPTSMKYGGKQVADSSFSWASGMRDLAGVSDSIAASAGLEAGFQRREEGWQHQVDLADHELADLEQQKEAANVRLEIAQRQLENHRRAIEHTQEVSDFYDEKFTGVNLYTWLASTLQRLYRQSYNSALAMARLAEHAFHFERPDLTDVRLSPTHWEAGHRGLLAGEQLVNELRTMERRFIETDDRHLEIDQAFSLQQVDPAALLRLKTSGECTFTIPERYFDLFYPGQYRRILKAARLTIPSVTGPYTNISATLHLLGSDIRRQPDLEEAPAPSHPSRTTTVATSTGQNDAGVFELTFRGERYLPFEGAGAVNSEWRLSLPKTFKPFDYDSINDVILRLSYTAEYDEDFRHDVERDNAGLEGSLTQVLTDDGLARALHLRHELSTTFHRLLHAELEQAIPFELTQEHFPLFVRDRPLAVKRALLVLQPAGDQNPGRIEFALDSESVSGFTDRGEVGGLPAADVTTAFAGDPRGEHSLEVRASGQLAPDDGTPPAVGSDKLEDLVLYIEYGLQART